MRFQVPQFIDVEDKIFGPFTFKQFIYMAGGAGISFILFKALPLFFSVLIGGPIIALSFALAFYKVNKQPFIRIMQSAFHYALSNKLYIWRKKPKKITPKEKKGGEGESGIFVPRLSESKLKDIAWSLDVHESIYAEQEPDREERLKSQREGIKMERKIIR